MPQPMSAPPHAEEIIALERVALERWCKGDPSGFLEISAEDVVYFDPFVPSRIDGKDKLTAHCEPLRSQIYADRFELLHPKVQGNDTLAVLTFDFISWSGEAKSRWHCTEVYRRDLVGWRLIQTHWSMPH